MHTIKGHQVNITAVAASATHAITCDANGIGMTWELGGARGNALRAGAGHSCVVDVDLHAASGALFSVGLDDALRVPGRVV